MQKQRYKMRGREREEEEVEMGESAEWHKNHDEYSENLNHVIGRNP